MGSLPDLTERSRPSPRPAASRTTSEPNKHKTHILPQLPLNTIYRKEWPWKKQHQVHAPPPPRRRDSVASSVGATSVRRLISRHPPKVPKTLVRRFSLLCVSSAFYFTALLPFTAYVGAETGAPALAVMHSVAAIIAPLSPLILQKLGTRTVICISHALVCVLLTAHTVHTPLPILYTLYGACGLSLSPLSLALAASATTLAQSIGDEFRRKVALRRALRAVRASQDLGLVIGSLLLGGALLIWPDASEIAILKLEENITLQGWPPPGEYFSDEDYEEITCGASGCPDAKSQPSAALSDEGQLVLLGFWSLLAFASISLAIFGATPNPSPPPDTRSFMKDPKTFFGMPMGLFIGLQQGFIYTSYIKWYGVCVGGWTCAWRALCGAGALQTLAAATFSMAAARGRRKALAAGGAAAHASLMLALLRWRAAKTDLALPAVAAAAWGACAALWDVLQASICIGGSGWRGPWSMTLSSRHAGMALACAARKYLCAQTQLAILAATLLVAMASHIALEIRESRSEPPRHRS